MVWPSGDLTVIETFINLGVGSSSTSLAFNDIVQLSVLYIELDTNDIVLSIISGA